MGFQRGIGLQIVGVVMGLIGLVVWGALLAFSSSPGGGGEGSTSENFHSWLASSVGRQFLDFLAISAVVILLLSVVVILFKRELFKAVENAPTREEDETERE